MPQSSFVDLLNYEEKIQYFAKLEKLGFANDEDDPFLVEESKPNEHLKKWSWPEVEFGNIYVYLIDCPGYTYQSLKSYKSLEAYGYFVNGLVRQLFIQHSKTGCCIICANVYKNQDISEESYNKAWVGLSNEDGSIITGHCTCMNGDSSTSICSHVIAVVFQVISASCICRKNKSSVSQACQTHEEMNNKDINSASQQNDCQTIVPDETKDAQVCNSNFSTLSPLEDRMQWHHGEEQTKTAEKEIEIPSFVSKKDDCFGIEISSMEKPLKCDKCPFTCFYQRGDFEKHMKRHHREKPFENNVCSKKLGFVYYFRRHMSSHTRGKPLKCNLCGKSFTFKNHLQRHMGTHDAGEKPFKCSICGKRFHFKYVFQRHMSIHTGERPFKCNVYDKSLQTHAVHKMHMKSHVGSKSFKCTNCDKCYARRYNLDMHVLRTHTGEKSLKYTVCGVGFSKEGLQEHLKIHKQKKAAFMCNTCGKIFNQRAGLTKHIRIHSANRPHEWKVCNKSCKEISHLNSYQKVHRENILKCNECGEGFMSGHYFCQQTQKHRGKKSFLCNVCHKCFAHNEEPQTHISVQGRGTLVSTEREECGNPSGTCEHQYPLKNLINERKYNCTECGKCFSERHKLKLHIRTHSDERPFICEECGESYKYIRNLKRHQRRHTGEKPFICNHCGKAFSLDANLKRHMKTHTGEKPFKCDVCGLCMTQKTSLQAHMRKHTGEKPFTCEICGKNHAYAAGFRRHLEKHTKDDKGNGVFSNDKSLLCAQCGFGFDDECSLRNHMKTHTGELPLRCEKCGRGFLHKNALQTHMNVHTGERSFVCEVCGKGFLYNCTLQIHMKTHTDQLSVKCEVCHRGFIGKGALQTHMRTHTGERPFKCEVCGQCFTQKSVHVTHMRMHTGERPYKCEMCDAAFGHPALLKQHIRRHTGEKPFVCNLCNRSFNCHSNLGRHMKSHSGDKPFTCDVCGKSFIQKTQLQTHIRTHTGEKPFKCNECGKSFGDSSTLSRHRKRHTNKTSVVKK